jgi:IMP cyclohydrolase
MYVGRIVAIGKNRNNKVCAMYRVSSRSFPNREARLNANGAFILPKPGFEDDIQKNPFIAYNCLSIVTRYAIVSNGSHTDFLTSKLGDGLSMRDALVTVLHSCDYEHDALDTPRIAAIVDRESGTGYLGIISKQSLHVQVFDLTPGIVRYVATYEHIVPGDSFGDDRFDAPSAEGACQYILSRGIFSEFPHPVTAACALDDESNGFTVTVANAD